MPEEQLWSYNCKDCCATFEASERLTQVVEQQGLTKQYAFQIKQLNKLAIPMMLKGIKIDLNARSKMSLELLESIAEFETKVKNMVPEELLMPASQRKKTTAPWYKSPTQLMTLFYDELGIKPVLNKEGRPTTGKNALPILMKREPLIKPIIEAISKLRSLNVFYGTFVSAQLDLDNRMRCSLNVAGTETFRWSSSANVFGRGTNLQNIPKGDEESKQEELRKSQGVAFPNVRKLFIPDTGYLLVTADLSGADAQVVAWETAEKELKDALKSGIKLHSVVSKERYGTDEQPYYDMCKRRIHATNYGGGAPNLHKTLAGLYGAKYTSAEIEQDFQDYWFTKYPGVKRWHEEVQHSVNTRNGVSNKFGFRIIYQDRIDTVFNEALAWIPQSTVSLVCLLGGLVLEEKFPFIEFLLQVHDELVFQIPKSKRTKLREIQSVLNSVTIPYDDPLQIPWSISISEKSWGDLRKYT